MKAKQFLRRFFGAFAALLIMLQPFLVYEAPTTGADPVVDHIVINEVSAASSPEWVELYNPTATSVDLSGWRILYTSASGSTTNFGGLVPSNTTIGSHGFFEQKMTTASQLANGGGTLALYDDNYDASDLDRGNVDPAFSYPGMTAAQSYARVYDASSKWNITNSPTEGVTNGTRTILDAPKLHPVASPTNQKQQTLSWDAVSGATSYTYAVASDASFTKVIASGSTIATSVPIQLSDDGGYYWRVQANAEEIDALPGVSTSSFRLDMVAPTISSTPVSGAVISGPGQQIILNLGGEDGSIDPNKLTSTCGKLTEPASAAAPYTLKVDTTSVPDGNCKLSVVATDAAGNQATQSFQYTVDNTAPSITFSQKDSYTKADNLTGSISDAHFDSATYTITTSTGAKVSGGVLQSGSFSIPLNTADFLIPNGTYNLSVSAQDSLGHTATSSSAFTLANPLPKIAFLLSSSAMSATNDATMTISGAITRPQSIQSLAIYSAETNTLVAQPLINQSTGEWSYSFSIPSAGTYRYYVVATDVFGNTVTTPVETRTISPYVPATIAINQDSLLSLTRPTAFKVVNPPASSVYEAPILKDDQASSSITTPNLGIVDQPRAQSGKATPVEPSSGGWRIFGVTWYWWVFTAILIVLAYMSRHKLLALLKK